MPLPCQTKLLNQTLLSTDVARFVDHARFREAYGAQEFLVGSDGSSCEVINRDPWCGCGPNVQWCTPPGIHFDDTSGKIRRALENEAPRVFEAIVRENRPYDEAFTTRETWVNGASAHFYAHHVGKLDEHDGN